MDRQMLRWHGTFMAHVPRLPMKTHAVFCTTTRGPKRPTCLGRASGKKECKKGDEKARKMVELLGNTWNLITQNLERDHAPDSALFAPREEGL
jgi:hypothetical protein